MKVAYLINQYPKTSHTFIRREVLALESLGVTVERIALRRTVEALVDPEDRQEQAKTAVVLTGGFFPLIAAALRILVIRPIAACRAAWLAFQMARRGCSPWKHAAYLLEAAWICERVRNSGAMHLHAHFGTNSATVALLVNALGGPPFSFTVHGPEEFDHPQSLSLPLKIRRARFVVAISQFGRSQLMRWCETSGWEKLYVVRCGVDERFLDTGPTDVPDTNRLICVGRLCEQKGHGVLLQAAQLLAKEGTDFEIILVGDGPLRAEIEREIESRGLSNRITISGWLTGDQVAANLRQSRALVLPSFAEGLPVVIMEALAMGRPVVSTYIAGIPELVVPGVSGWLVPAGAPLSLCRAIRELLDAPLPELARMGREGARRVARDHCALTEAAKLRDLIQHAVTRTGPSLESGRKIIAEPVGF